MHFSGELGACASVCVRAFACVSAPVGDGRSSQGGGLLRVRVPPGLEARQQQLSSTMDYLFGIVVLLCGAVHVGRGGEPRHNVPRLKLSFKGKPDLSLCLSS